MARWIVPQEDVGNEEIMAPDYNPHEISKRIDAIDEKPDALTDYLWDHGQLKRTITGPDPNKESWRRWILQTVIYEPLIYALNATVRERLFDNRSVTAWDLDAGKLDELIDQTISFEILHRNRITALVPLMGLTFAEGTRIELAPDIAIQHLTKREEYLSFGASWREYLWHDFKAPYFTKTVAEISFEVPTGQQTDIVKLAQDRLDLLKWAFFTGLGLASPIAEGTCIIKGLHDRVFWRFRRDETIGESDVNINENDAIVCKALVRGFRGTQKEELNDALWHFGRGCVAALHRDVLFESVIGLDRLLVGGQGEPTYRFSLHGAALLAAAGEDGQPVYELFEKIYQQRGKAAHGHQPEVKQLATTALQKLALVIRIIIDMIGSGRLDARKTTAVAIRDLVIRKAIS
jgi:hypothetical protein